MKQIKTTLLALVLLSGIMANAQDAAYTNMIKIGVNAGFALPSENASSNIGVDLGYQHLVTPGFGLGIVTGYNQFLGKDNDGIKNNDFAVVPVAVLFRYYPQTSGFYLGADLGYGFITGDKHVASNSPVERPSGGLYFKPEVGYHNINWNFALQYTKVFTGSEGNIGSQDYSVGALGLGIGYNLPLGK
jgi:hypothetical protein